MVKSRENRKASGEYTRLLFFLAFWLTAFFGCDHAYKPHNSDKTFAAELDSVKTIYKTTPQAALHICDSILAEVDADKDKEVFADALIWKARTLTQLNEFEQAVEVWNRLFAIQPELSPELNYDATSSLTLLHYRLGNGDNALTYSRSALNTARNIGDPLLITKAASNVSAVLNSLGKHDSALYYENLALQTVSELNNDSLLRFYQVDLAVIYLESEMYDSAFHYLRLGIRGSADSETQRICHLNLGLAFERTNQPDSALVHYEEALRLAHEANDRHMEILALQNIGYLSNSIGDFEKAFLFLDSATMMEQENDRVLISEKINELELKYQDLEREKEVERLRFETDRASLVRNTTIIIAILVVLLAALAINYFVNRLRTARALAAKQAEQFEREKEVVSLQSMLVAQEEERKRIALDLHDGIGIILSTARIRLSRLERNLQENERQQVVHHTEELMDRASQELRRVAQDMMPAVLTKLGLIEGLEDLVDRVRSGSDIEVVFTHNKYSRRFSEKIEVMIFRVIQELLNNGIKHSKAGRIDLAITAQDEIFTIRYTDDGVGFDTSEFLDKGGLGLKSIASRVKFMAGTLDVKSSKGKGASFTIAVPYEK